MADLTRPIIGIENRTAQEVFDIMCDRFRRSSPSQVAPANPAQVTDAARQEAMSLVENYGDDPKGLLVGAIAACLQRFAAIGAGGQAVAWQQRELKNGQWSDWYPSNKEAYEEHQAGVEGALSRYEVRALTPTQPHPADERMVEALHLTEYEIQVLLGTSVSGCNMSSDRNREARIRAAAPSEQGGDRS